MQNSQLPPNCDLAYWHSDVLLWKCAYKPNAFSQIERIIATDCPCRVHSDFIGVGHYIGESESDASGEDHEVPC